MPIPAEVLVVTGKGECTVTNNSTRICKTRIYCRSMVNLMGVESYHPYLYDKETKLVGDFFQMDILYILMYFSPY